jgi:hypothetical protein
MLNIVSAGLLLSATNRNGATSAHTTATITNSLFQPFMSARSHARLRKFRPDIRAAFAAAGADEAGLDVGQSDVVAPAARIGLDVMAAAVIAAIDQHIAATALAHLAEGDLLRRGRDMTPQN